MRNRFRILIPIAGSALLIMGAATPTLSAEPQQQGASQPQPQGVIQFIQGETPNDMLITNIRGSEVRNRAGESIGRVDDVVIDRSGRVSAIVVGVGGFLGIGEKDVGIAFHSVQFERDSSGNRIAVLDTNKDTLKSAPAYQKTESSGSRIMR